MGSMIFMFREQWYFEKKAFIFPIIYIIFDLAVSLIAIWLPKVVLDMINRPGEKFVASLIMAKPGEFEKVWEEGIAELEANGSIKIVEGRKKHFQLKNFVKDIRYVLVKMLELAQDCNKSCTYLFNCKFICYYIEKSSKL